MKTRIPRAETFSSLTRRVRRFLDSIQKSMKTKNILIVAHGGPLSAMVLTLLGLPSKEFPHQIQAPGSVRMITGRELRTLC